MKYIKIIKKIYNYINVLITSLKILKKVSHETPTKVFFIFLLFFDYLIILYTRCL